MTAPRDVVVVLLDSLNRHMLGCYGGGEFDTPNLDRLAARSVRFTNHHTGSLPCMPARHDLLVGALDFPLPGYRMPRPDHRAWLDRAPGTDVPVIRQPFDPSDDLPFWAGGRFAGDVLYDRAEADATGDVRNQAGGSADAEMAELLVEALRSIEAPEEQLARLGLG